MNFINKCIGVIALTTLTASAVTTVTVSNLQSAGADDSAILDNAGNIILNGSGSVQVGYFDTFMTQSDFSSSTINSLLGDFISFSGASTNFSNSFGVDGFFTSEFTDTITPGDDIIGETLFTLVGNNSTITGSTEFLVFRHDGVLFEEEVAGVGVASGLVQSGQGTLLLGAEGAPVTVAGTQVGSFTLTALPVPEPSSTLLIGLAGIGMTLRRRRSVN